MQSLHANRLKLDPRYRLCFILSSLWQPNSACSSYAWVWNNEIENLLINEEISDLEFFSNLIDFNKLNIEI